MKRNEGVTNNQRQRTLPRYKDKLMGIPVVLLNSAYEASYHEEIGVIVPDISALEAAVAVARVTINSKLSGNEIKCLRKAIGKKANEIASFLDMSSEHYSRLESNGTLATNAERIFRLRVLHSLRDKAKGVPAKDDDILNMAFVPFRSSLEPVTLIFDRVNVLNDGLQEVWHFVGIDSAEGAAGDIRSVA